jgi:hypothetical protein
VPHLGAVRWLQAERQQQGGGRQQRQVLLLRWGPRVACVQEAAGRWLALAIAVSPPSHCDATVLQARCGRLTLN